MSVNIPFERGAIRASECISDAWELIKDDYWLFFGMVILGTVLIGCIPCVNVFVAGPFMVGIYIALGTKHRGGRPTFEQLFKGFEKFVPAMVIGLIINIPAIISTIVQYSANVAEIVMKERGRGANFFAASDPDFSPALAGGLLLLIGVIAVLWIFFAVAWHITFMFALPLISEHDLSIGEALSLSARAGWSNPGGIIVLMILEFLVMLLGLLALCIGMFFVLPVIIAANFIAYRMVFPPVQPQQQYQAPPSPDFYGSTFGNQA